MRHSLVQKAFYLDDSSFRTLAEVSPAGMWRTTADGMCTYVNPAWLKATGLDDGAWQGTGWADALHPADAERVATSFAAAVAKGEIFHDQWRWLRPDGEAPWVLCMGAPEFDAEGRIVGYVGINVDISETHALTEKLQDERQKAEDAAHAKTRFLANMSHEIRTPMNGVIGFTDLLLGTDLDPVQRRYTTLIADSGRAMMSLLNDILDISKIEAGQMTLDCIAVELPRVLRHCASLLEPSAIAKGIDLQVDIDPGLPRNIQTDPLRLRQILLNLLGNAVKFTENGAVTLHAKALNNHLGPRIVILVADTGIGIDTSKLDSIFDPFSQADGSTARVHGGTGLGLSISRQLAQRMGGALLVSSSAGAGSTFTLDLPLVRVDQPLVHSPGEALDQDGGSLAGRRVLVAEDHDINQQLILSMLGRMGIEAELACDGEQAVEMVQEAANSGRPFEAVLMDVQMPRLDGLSAARRLRRLGFGGDSLPIVALSANCYPDDIAECLESGMQDHVSKPVSRASLTASLSAVLAASAIEPVAPSHEKPPVEVRFALMVSETLDRIGSAIAKNDGEQADSIGKALHDIAGLAACFDRPDLGEISSRAQRELKCRSSGDEKLALLRSVLPQLLAAA